MLDLKREYEYMKEEIDTAIRQCLGHQKWILGPEVREFEDKVAQYLGAAHCIGVSSGTDALVLALPVLAGRRDALQQQLKQANIDSMVYYPVPLHRMGVFQGRIEKHGQLEGAEAASKEVLSLPIEPMMTEEEMNRIGGIVASLCRAVPS